MKDYGAGASTLTSTAGLSAGRKASLITGAVITVLVVLLNVPGNPVMELRRAQAGGMLLAHAGMVLLAVGLWPLLSRTLVAAADMDGRRLFTRLGAVVVAVAGAMILLAAGRPDYARQLLTREWGVVEPVQFVLYLLVARLCFVLADRWPRRTSSRRLYLLGGWLGRLFALEEIDYLGVLSSLVRLAGVERARIGGSYVGALHDTLNVAAQFGLFWLAGIVLAVGALGAAWWIGGGQVGAARDMLSWRLAPGVVGAAFMALAQFKDVDGRELDGGPSRLLDTLLEEPCELLAILCVNVTLVLELAYQGRQAVVRVP